MQKMLITGGRALKGVVRASGSKNAALPVLAASLLTEEPCTIRQTPRLDDVKTMFEVLGSLGAKADFETPGTASLQCSDLHKTEAPWDPVRKMRASILVMGPLLARMGRARLYLPGGCAIGARPIDLHLKGFAALGATVSMDTGVISVSAKRLCGARIYLDFPSVGATENIMMAATLAHGTTYIENAAEEPEVVDVANFLAGMGANIAGAGTNVIRIDGVKTLSGADHSVIPDRIEAGTYLLAAAISRGDVTVENVVVEHLKPLIAKLRECGIDVSENAEGRVRAQSTGRPIAKDLKTMPYPGFPTDMQAPFMALMAVADGVSLVTENVFENRFMHVPEMCRMGADISIEGRSAIVRGKENISGAHVRAYDLRAGAALTLLALAANGESEIVGLEHIDRGYEQFESKLKRLGANIKRL